MSNFIPDEILEQIQDSLDIVEVIDEYLPLKNSGRNFKALCPFHIEKTPSFVVSPEKQIFHCFGCGEGGNMFSFLMKHLNINFPEAAELLAKKSGINIPKKSKYKENDISKKIYKINNIVSKYYSKQLFNNKQALDYLKNRGFSKNIIEDFSIGYAKDEWDQVLRFIKRKGYSVKLLEKAGLVISKKKKEGWYDRFRNRIIFPIFDVNSRIIGFGGRTLGEELPKYINSPETKVYSKRKNLYGLNFSKTEIRKKNYIIIVEGYTDVLSLYQVGIKNVVSNLGTALTSEHIRKIKRFTDNVIVVYDSDEAGKLASLRSLNLLIEQDMRVKLICLPSKKDPDTYIKEFGKESFLECIKESEDLLDYKLHILNYKSKSDDVHKKKEIINDILLTIEKVNDYILKNEYLKRLAQCTDIEEHILRKQLKILTGKKGRGFISHEDKTQTYEKKSLPHIERLLLRAILENEKALLLAKKRINVDSFDSPIIKKIIKRLFELDLNDKELDISLNRIMTCFDDEKINKLLASIFCEFETMPRYKEILVDCMKSIELKELNSQLFELKKKLKDADSKKKEKLLFTYNDLCKEITNLKKQTI